MKLHYLALAFITFLGTTTAQVSTSGLVGCATKCANDALPKSCNAIDAKCICSNKPFISQMSCCVSKSCPKDSQDSALDFARKLCGGVGVHDLPDHASCDGSSSGGSTSTASSASETSSSSSSSSSESSSASSTGSSSSSAASETASADAGALNQGKDSAFAAAAGAVAFALLA